MLNKVASDLKSVLPSELVDALLTSYAELWQNYFLGRLEPSELNGGKFCEACIRILQYETNSHVYTALGTRIPDMIRTLKNFENLPAAASNDSYRIHIPRTLIIMYDIRSKRGVGHLGGDVNPNRPDAGLLITCAAWVLAELFRIHYQCSLDDAQRIVDLLVQRPLTLVYEVDQIKRVLLPSLSHEDQTLVLLAAAFPNKLTVAELVKSIEPANVPRYRSQVLGGLHRRRFIEYQRPDSCIILPPGLHSVESRYPAWLKKLNEEM